jgi:hypothetical protein
MDPKPYWPGHEDRLRYQSVVFTDSAPQRETLDSCLADRGLGAGTVESKSDYV